MKLSRNRIAGAERRVREYFHFRLFGGTPLVLCLLLLWPFGGARKVRMMAGSVTPGATATITVKRGNNGNTALDIKAKNLAPPSSLTPAENVYVVWIEAPSQTPQNQGRLRVNQNEQAEIHTSTSFKGFKVVITAEQNSQTQEPTGPRILSADIARD